MTSATDWQTTDRQRWFEAITNLWFLRTFAHQYDGDAVSVWVGLI